MTPPRPPASAYSLPRAAIEQGDIEDVDLAMTEYARLRHPAVRWWWGQRVVDTTNGAYCYLCDRLVATWARRWPVPAVAIRAILGHRANHALAAVDSPGILPPARSAGDDAPPTGGQA